MSTTLNVFTADVLREAVNQVFTSMIFMSVDPTAPINEPVTQQTSVMASVSFMGNFEGSLTLRCSMACAKAVTANLLGFEEDEPIEQSDIADAMGEVSNMVLGSVKSATYDKVGELIASAPTVFSGDHMEHHLRAGEVRLSTTVGVDDTYCMEVHVVYIDGK
ncbi:MAG: chemotaxis protein CheX [Pontiellaceae bacterium]|nr:chemotaxis protein CheX [Pontiellaceae bacterium]MBN2785802.1 chemotaxis protein CheX [Pontiellaceae bacterium]